MVRSVRHVPIPERRGLGDWFGSPDYDFRPAHGSPRCHTQTESPHDRTAGEGVKTGSEGTRRSTTLEPSSTGLSVAISVARATNFAPSAALVPTERVDRSRE